MKPDLTRIPSFYHKYVSLVEHGDLKKLLQENKNETTSFLNNIPEEKWTFRYAPEKWNIKQLVLHMTDTERIFSYRALCFARGEAASLPGFDENGYAAASNADLRTKQSLLQELESVQAATITLFESFDETQMNLSGIANGNPIYVGGIGFTILGHMQHHKKILNDKYLN